ncbi:MAG TPA: dTDP-4-amino-4,6-dideoxygalactose transaminase [Chitinophagales bacterium]|nr:dTDP-4-amino-4,6-dideoxygalactose transaminase [Chitinophagales bacterium]
MHIPFNKPFLIGNETKYIEQAVRSGKISGDGIFTKKCHSYFEKKYGFKKALLTTSCTDALEMCAILLDIKDGDEVIVPSYTFVSTVNAFLLRGAKLVFIDSKREHPGMEEHQIEALISPKTKAIVVVHYAGVACNMDTVMDIAKRHNLFVVEDAAQAINSFYTDKTSTAKPLGSIGHLSAFSFHETKNIISGEGGLLAINDERFIERAEIIREKGTNRSKFFRGEVDKYSWVDIGSSFLPSDIIAAFLYAQLEYLSTIQAKRIALWNTYNDGLQAIKNKVQLPFIPNYATNNAHMYFLVCNSLQERTALIKHLKDADIHAVFHYLSLHKSPFYEKKHDGRNLPLADHYSDCLIRLPMYYELEIEDVKNRIVKSILEFYKV